MPRPINFSFQQAGNNFKLFIYDDVTKYGKFNWSTWTYEESETSAKFFKQELDNIPDGATLELHINSNGGSATEGVTIYNMLKQKNCKKVGVVDGVAYSVAFLILQACDERVMCLGTSALIHEMWVETCGNAKALRKMADDLDVLMQSNRQVFLERSNMEEQALIDMMEKETYLTPDQCLEYGLIDRIDGKAEGNAVQEQLQQQLMQLKTMMAEQKTAREQILLLAQQSDSGSKKKPTPNNFFETIAAGLNKM